MKAITMKLYAVKLGDLWFAGIGPTGKRTTSMQEPWTTFVLADAEQVVLEQGGTLVVFTA